MWLKPDPHSPWANPCRSIRLTREVYEQYKAAYEGWQRQWYAAWPGVDADPRWYARANPPAARGYPPGFLRRGLQVAVFVTASSPDTDGYFWANDRVITDVDSYGKLELALLHVPEPVDMLILTGECLQVSGPACGVCWRELNDVGFDGAMPPHIAGLLRAKIKPTGLFVLGSCHAGDDPALVQRMADVIGRPVAGACGVCRGVRDFLGVEGDVYWTLGGYADGGAYTLREPANL